MKSGTQSSIFSVLIYVGLNIALASYAVFLPTIIKDMNFSSLNAQLLTIPPYVAACFLVFVSQNRLCSASFHLMHTLRHSLFPGIRTEPSSVVITSWQFQQSAS